MSCEKLKFGETNEIGSTPVQTVIYAKIHFVQNYPSIVPSSYPQNQTTNSKTNCDQKCDTSKGFSDLTNTE